MAKSGLKILKKLESVETWRTDVVLNAEFENIINFSAKNIFMLFSDKYWCWNVLWL